MGKKLTDSQIEAYHRDGFLSPVDIFTEAEAAEIRATFEEAEAKWPEAFEGAARNNAHMNFKFLDDIVHNSIMIDAVEDLIGPDIIAGATVLFIKEAHDPGFVSWHQDGRYMGMEPLTGVTAWLALSPSTLESGCMQMIPGSHIDGIRDHDDTYGEQNILTRGQEIHDIDAGRAVATPLRPGQASFHSQRVIHASEPNSSDDRRIGFAIQSYMPPEIRHVVGASSAQWVRGAPPNDHFEIIPRASGDMASADIAMRDKANAQWSEILYHGAEKRRDF
ncbi:MAG: phytanoyl-CoA dioxygenase family protein [Pseudomonadota bacterium]